MLKNFVYFIVVTGVAILFVFIVYGLFVQGSHYSLRSSYSFINNVFPETSFRTVFVGDIMLDRAVAQYAKKLGPEHIFAGVEYVFRTADAVIGNLEGSLCPVPLSCDLRLIRVLRNYLKKLDLPHLVWQIITVSILDMRLMRKRGNISMRPIC